MIGRRKADLYVFQDYGDLSINVYNFCVSVSIEYTITLHCRIINLILTLTISYVFSKVNVIAMVSFTMEVLQQQSIIKVVTGGPMHV